MERGECFEVKAIRPYKMTHKINSGITARTFPFRIRMAETTRNNNGHRSFPAEIRKAVKPLDLKCFIRRKSKIADDKDKTTAVYILGETEAKCHNGTTKTVPAARQSKKSRRIFIMPEKRVP